jgi:hypothetical protein
VQADNRVWRVDGVTHVATLTYESVRGGQ